MFVIEWLGPPEADGQNAVLDRIPSTSSDLNEVISKAKQMRQNPPSFPGGSPLGLRIVDEAGLQHWLGTAGDIEASLG
ncbi:MAG: hypothetical protein WBX25_28090 [Rhodomicrobium sp.]